MGRRKLYSASLGGTIVLLTFLLSATACVGKTAASEGSVPAGTEITYANWQQFKQFMPSAMQALFAGDHFWKLPKQTQIEVGPTITISLPPAYLSDTEKYSHLVKLKRLADGGYVPEGYVAGIPFPTPLRDPALAPPEIFYDLYYHYNPRLQRSLFCDYSGDRYGNFTSSSKVESVYSQLAYLSDPNTPHTLPTAGGYYFAKYIQQIAPEQGKYTTSLALTYQDVTKLDDIYTYLPTLRRPLRSSDAARCAPLQNTDFTWEDAALGPPGLPQQFEFKYLGEKQILALVHALPAALEQCGTGTSLPAEYYYKPSKGVLPWGKPSLGKWELRHTYVIEMSRLPPYSAGYCYSRRVLYIDKDTLLPLGVVLYDPTGRLEKYITQFWTPQPIPGDGAMPGINGAQTGWAINFGAKHVTISLTESSCYDSNCNASYLNTSRYASPEGLMKIVQ